MSLGGKMSGGGAGLRRLLLCLGLLSGCGKQPATLAPAWHADGEAINSAFGLRAMGLGDINGDGYGDLAVGAPAFENGRGKAYVYCGGPQGLGAAPCWSQAGANVGDRYGDRLGQAGDVNGDGYADLYVAVPSWKQGPGRCEVFHGGPQGLGAKPAWAREGRGDDREQYGDCTHPTGDVNADGYDDLLVGAYQALSTTGRAELFLGGPKGLGAAPVWRGQGEAEGDQYAYTLSHAGDLDGDGYPELIIGAKFHDASAELGLPEKARFMAGKAYIHRGGPQGLEAQPAWTLLGWEARAQYSVRSYGAGDLDGDGGVDLMLSAPGADEGRGVLRLLHGKDRSVFAEIKGRDLGVSDFARAAGPAGDFNGDGHPDVLAAGRVGDQGRVFVWFGGPQQRWKAPDLRVKAEDESGAYGAWVAPAGDLDGDGLDDLVIGAELYSGVRALAGRVSVVYGKQGARTQETVRKSGLSVYLPRPKVGKR